MYFKSHITTPLLKFTSIMAASLESMALSASSRPPSSLPPSMSSPSSRIWFSSGRITKYLPGFTGLKIQAPLKSSSASSCSKVPRVSPYKTGIVCEAQDTALDSQLFVPPNFFLTSFRFYYSFHAWAVLFTTVVIYQKLRKD